MVKLQAHENEFVMVGEANDTKNKIVDGNIIEKTEEEIAALKEKNKPDSQERLIQKKMNELLRKMAIDELKKEGKIK